MNRSPVPFTVGLFVTCAVDLLRPSVAFAAVKLLELSGCEVVVPPQSCCGQVAYNNGLPDDTRALALAVVDAFAEVDYVVAPSGSCASMLKHHYPALFDGNNPQANTFAAKVYELSQFLTEVVAPKHLPGSAGGRRLAYHDSCAGLRELGIHGQPRALIRRKGDDEVLEIAEGQSCCGFGGTFCVKFPDIANRMVTDKADNIARLQPDLLLGGDLTCLIHIAGKLQRLGHDAIEVRHIAEYLAGDWQTPAIGLGGKP